MRGGGAPRQRLPRRHAGRRKAAPARPASRRRPKPPLSPEQGRGPARSPGRRSRGRRVAAQPARPGSRARRRPRCLGRRARARRRATGRRPLASRPDPTTACPACQLTSCAASTPLDRGKRRGRPPPHRIARSHRRLPGRGANGKDPTRTAKTIAVRIVNRDTPVGVAETWRLRHPGRYGPVTAPEPGGTP